MIEEHRFFLDLASKATRVVDVRDSLPRVNFHDTQALNIAAHDVPLIAKELGIPVTLVLGEETQRIERKP